MASSFLRKFSGFRSKVAKEMFDFPKTVEGFGYTFNQDGQLRKIDPTTGKPGNEGFQFNVKPNDPTYNQLHYEALGEVINDHIYKLLQERAGLRKVDLGEEDPKSFIFVSKDFESNSDRLLVLVHGSGVVRAGQWARRLIINQDLATGTQLPFIEKALTDGYAVVVANTNDNTRFVGGKKKPIPGSETAENHMQTLWRYLDHSPARHIAVVAHSYGGVCVLHLATEEKESFEKRTFAVALTDSVHFAVSNRVPDEVMKFLRKVGRNWVASDKPLDTPIKQSQSEDIPRVSAGHTQHEMTSYCSMESIFRFFQEKYQDSLKDLK